MWEHTVCQWKVLRKGDGSLRVKGEEYSKNLTSFSVLRTPRLSLEAVSPVVNTGPTESCHKGWAHLLCVVLWQLCFHSF